MTDPSSGDRDPTTGSAPGGDDGTADNRTPDDGRTPDDDHTSDGDHNPDDDRTPDGGAPVDAPVSAENRPSNPSDRETSDGSTGATDGDSPLRAVGSAVGVGVVGVLVYVVVSFLLAAIGAAVGGFSLAVSLGLSLVVGQYVAFVGVGLVYFQMRGFGRHKIVEYIGIRRPSLSETAIAVVGAVAAFVLAIALSSIVLSVGAEPAQNQGAEVALQNPAIIPLIIALMFLVVGPCEEFLFRGVVQSRVRESLSAVPSIVIASAVFAPAHAIALSGGGITGVLLSIGLLFFPSLLFGGVYEYTDNLVVPALMHAIYNSILLSLAYVAIAYGAELEEAAEAGALLTPL